MTDPVREIGYDAGVRYEKDFHSNPCFTEHNACQDFRAIRHELNYTAVLIIARNPERLADAAKLAAQEGLDIWLHPRPFDRPVSELREAVRADGTWAPKRAYHALAQRHGAAT